MVVHSVLIVDDDQLVRESLAEVTADLGCEPRCAGCGGEALTQLRRQSCGLLVSDVDMPDLSGFALVDRVHALVSIHHSSS
jgi:CheY-like chemotaxis protein